MTSQLNRDVFDGDRVCLQEIVTLGWSVFTEARPDSLPSHVHDDVYEICYIDQGLVEWWVDTDHYAVRGGDIFITWPGEQHGGIGGVMNPCELYWIQIDLHGLKDRLHTVGDVDRLQRDIQSLPDRHLPGTKAILNCFEMLLGEHRQPTAYSALVAGSVLIQLLVEVLRAHQQHERRQIRRKEVFSPPVQQAINYINANLANPLLVQDISGAANISTSYFHQRFVQETGMTPADYRTRQRIQRAKQLLKNPKLSVTEIAYQLGFSSSQYFSSVFKRYTGHTPTSFRKQ